MKAIPDIDIIQIEITNSCVRQCSNCTRFVGHAKKPFFMDFEFFKKAVDSLDGHPGRIGIMGGEPLLHPQFKEFCEYLSSKRERIKCGLWSTFPKGKESYRETIVKTFGSVFLNDHSVPGIMHTPLLVASDEVMEDKEGMWYLIHHCWVQNTWSASINPNGAFFCEIAGAFATLFNEQGWDIKEGWWKKTPKDFITQMEKYCLKCGAAIPLWRRDSIDGKCDISPKNLDLLKTIDSPKVLNNKYEIYTKGLVKDDRKMFGFSDLTFRQKVAAKYNIGLINGIEPYLMEDKCT